MIVLVWRKKKCFSSKQSFGHESKIIDSALGIKNSWNYAANMFLEFVSFESDREILTGWIENIMQIQIINDFDPIVHHESVMI